MPANHEQTDRERTDRELLLLIEQSAERMGTDITTLFEKLETFRKENDARLRDLGGRSDDRFRGLERNLWIGVGGLAVIYPFLQWLLTR